MIQGRQCACTKKETRNVGGRRICKRGRDETRNVKSAGCASGEDSARKMTRNVRGVAFLRGDAHEETRKVRGVARCFLGAVCGR